MLNVFGNIADMVFKQKDDNRQSTQWAPIIGHLLAVLAILLMGILLARFKGTPSLVRLSLIIIASSLALGGSLGFLFGIPRVNGPDINATTVVMAAENRQNPEQVQVNAVQDARSAKSRKRRLLNTNTNLEKVSDWLTTMLVGVGLTQLGNVNDALVGFRNFLTDYAIVYPDAAQPMRAGLLPAIGPLLLISGLTLGFVYFYVFTRVVITPRFDDVENALETGRALVFGTQAVSIVKEVAHELPLNTIATRNVVASATPTVDDSLSVMFEALYQPEGYQNAIRVGEALRGSDAINRADYWFFLAAAYGQQFRTSATDEDKTTARSSALDAARRAVEINATYRARLWAISDPGSYDDDLAGFRDDPEFLKIVGRPAKH